MRRPLYHDFAWAYDAVVAQPAGPAAEAVAEALAAHGVPAGSSLVDAGCGTGRYAAAFAGLGYLVTGVDLSPELVAVAERAAPDARFEVADLRSWTPAEPFDAALCRGVLNDLIDDADRVAALAGLRRSLRAGGVLVADVRDWERTARRYEADPAIERTADTPRGRVVFTSHTTLEPDTHTMRIRERIAVGDEPPAEFDFAMRCWTREELQTALPEAGFAQTELNALEASRPDRITVLATVSISGSYRCQ
ncbi:MAG TPA: class I SAM-dependent methyltransferase [Thermoleophilaceae bacterium]|nr:class I SAM-dependent methyltransferase [Thermoleophilaceae bacterium]